MVRITCESLRAEPLTREKAKQIFLEKIELEYLADEKLAELTTMNQQEVQLHVLVERTRVIDQIYMNHKAKLVDLQRA